MMAAGAAQVRMFSDDGICVHDPLVMRRALEYATGLGVLVAQHAEEPRLTVGAVAHEGPNAARLGLAGWPRAAEESIVARDALLIPHLSYDEALSMADEGCPLVQRQALAAAAVADLPIVVRSLESEGTRVGRMDGWADGRMERWMDGKIERSKDRAARQHCVAN